MSRHAKNNTASSIFTYHEKTKLNYGTRKATVGHESIKNWDACSICLLPAVDPMCCCDGHMFCKECILQNALRQKKDIKQRTQMWEKQQQMKQEEKKQQDEETKQKAIEEFDKREAGIVVSGSAASKPLDTAAAVKADTMRSTKMTCFWVVHTCLSVHRPWPTHQFTARSDARGGRET
eukprot:TRINITY_DN5188_c0_g1_i1.p1 TRINITY_DN5188_c0_g1~~TRINITY_DN5188_c0_g1_i1.p1  ORF type:complete len:178 (+),score=48.08 TRINITY_DN5188_c0_g1_i1:39-572(+)